MINWKYQLVYQFPFLDGDMAQFLRVIALEDQLIGATAYRPVAEVDGHDAGSGEMNIFLMTDTPREAFDGLAPVVNPSSAAQAWGFRAAYRDLKEDEYHLLWPDDGPPFDVK